MENNHFSLKQRKKRQLYDFSLPTLQTAKSV